MTKEELYEVVQKAVDMRGGIRISFHFVGCTKDAYDLLQPFVKLGRMVKGSHKGTEWVEITNEEHNIAVTAFLGTPERKEGC